jgi:hypothetical protein
LRITDRIESRERCAESGWYAYDFLLDEPMDAEFIKSLRAVGGSFVFMTMLKKPFFKIESDYYIIKGVEGNNYFRMAVHEEHVTELERIEKIVMGGTVADTSDRRP